MPGPKLSSHMYIYIYIWYFHTLLINPVYHITHYIVSAIHNRSSSCAFWISSQNMIKEACELRFFVSLQVTLLIIWTESFFIFMQWTSQSQIFVQKIWCYLTIFLSYPSTAHNLSGTALSKEKWILGKDNIYGFSPRNDREPPKSTWYFGN